MDDTDPEVLADLALRAQTLRTRRPAGMETYNWSAPVHVEHWPCTRCGAMVGVTQEGVDTAAVFDSQLARAGEPPLKRTKIMWCDKCLIERNKYGQALNRKQVDRIAYVVRELKETPPPGPERERELVEQLRQLYHPDVDGLVTWLRERREREGNARPGKRRL